MSFTAFAVAPSQNVGTQNDATGAFHVGAHAFSKAYNCPWRKYDNSVSTDRTRKNFYDAIDQACPAGLELFAYFGHGIKNGLPSPHVYSDKHLDELVEVLRPKISKPFVAVLYACSSGAAGGLSGKLREKFGGDVWVYGHTSVGHSFMNPDVSEEATDKSPGYRTFYPYGSDLRAAWAEALKFTDLWMRFPLLTDDLTAAWVNSRRLLGTWEVTGNGSAAQLYEFDTAGTGWTDASGNNFYDSPSGTVKALDPKKRTSVLDRGTWEINEQVAVKWASGAAESWPLPLKAVGQTVNTAGSVLTAKRLTHTLGHGKLQG
jgi:hypothetical protein